MSFTCFYLFFAGFEGVSLRFFMGLNSQKRGFCQQTWDLFFPWKMISPRIMGLNHPWKKQLVRCELSGGLLRLDFWL